MNNAIEYDYKKTLSLTTDKYGRMENFLREINLRGTIEDFIGDKCSISKNKIENVTNRLIKSNI